MSIAPTSCFVAAVWLMIVAPHVQSQGYGTIQPVLVQKDGAGRLTSNSTERLEAALVEIADHALRAWVSPRIKSSSAPRISRVRAIQQRIVRNLNHAMGTLPPVPLYPTSGTYVSVSINVQGAEALVRDRNVEAFWILVPVY